ncbi:MULTISPECIES: H-NS family nucleoid-associated regulatory protein [Sulfitobacter]|jgi:DNA-binding protein H-NS|uniref:H-NS family nucleoid-associated regulatory protein n=1 Tax=Sulfitobacter profundi TaxID=2679961 RepID=A0ABW1Z4Y2_9RHOB|nr:H-NS histone family protein [Sulfitobacter indolifex]
MFTKNDLKAMSRKELERLLSDVKKALQAARNRDQREARKAATKAAAEFGFSLGEISETQPSAPPKKRAKVKKASKPSIPMYANPDDKKQTWTGKGRQPNWFRSQIESGTAPDAMRI